MQNQSDYSSRKWTGQFAPRAVIDAIVGSLRQALTIANDGDTINFAVSGTITLTSGELLIAKNVTISGPGADQLSIDGNSAQFQCVFGVTQTTVTISGLTITNGHCGVYNDHGTLTVSDCVVTGNSGFGSAPMVRLAHKLNAVMITATSKKLPVTAHTLA